MAKSERSKIRVTASGARVAGTDIQWPGAARILGTATVAILMAAEVARITVANAVADENPALAARLAPSSPMTLVSTSMGEVGIAARQGEDVSQPTLQRLRVAAGAAPLHTAPFLVAAAIAERNGDLARAESLLEMARLRDPRSIATLYLLADVSLRQNNVVQGLRELALLSRILPGASVKLVPALADYARAPGARATLDQILKSNPELRRPLLVALSADPDNTGLAIELAGPELRSPEPEAQVWKSRLLSGLIERGDYGRAYTVWRTFAGFGPSFAPLLFNGEFKAVSAPPPFNWSYTAGSAGIAEPASGRLRILFYGKNEQSLIAQLLLLKPGNYRFAAPTTGNAPAGALEWTLTCNPGGRPIMQLPVGSASTETHFAVPADCPAQKLELKGHPEDMPQDSDVQIGPVRLEKANA
ncbi:MAG TPA: hypothetical protein VNS53_06170 [Sphingomicrobium sp.]|jgi:hypothetical protein|nr:hypothetical protein [Sphingomicrobium sp.]